jgi:hypothetical protein
LIMRSNYFASFHEIEIAIFHEIEFEKVEFRSHEIRPPAHHFPFLCINL